MAQAEKTAAQTPSTNQNGGNNNVVSLGPRDILQGRLEIQGDLKIAGNVEGDLKASLAKAKSAKKRAKREDAVAA